jgi:hypothetical protein
MTCGRIGAIATWMDGSWTIRGYGLAPKVFRRECDLMCECSHGEPRFDPAHIGSEDKPTILSGMP